MSAPVLIHPHLDWGVVCRQTGKGLATTLHVIGINMLLFFPHKVNIREELMYVSKIQIQKLVGYYLPSPANSAETWGLPPESPAMQVR